MSSDKSAQSSAAEEMKRKFKEALDKKNAQRRQGEKHLDGNSSVHAQQGAHTRREFRRKSS